MIESSRPCSSCCRLFRKFVIVLFKGDARFCSHECYIYYYSDIQDLMG